MGSSFVEFRGRGFWAKDTPLQVAMFGIARTIERIGDSSSVLTKWRETLSQQMVWGGGGCVYTGIDDVPEFESVDALARAVERAIATRSDWLVADELTQGKVGWGGFESAPHLWQWKGVESDGYTVPAVHTVLAAFLELLGGGISPEFGQLVYGAKSEDAHARMIPGGDWRVARAQEEARLNELVKGPLQTNSFAPDSQVRYVPLDDGGAAGKR